MDIDLYMFIVYLIFYGILLGWGIYLLIRIIKDD